MNGLTKEKILLFCCCFFRKCFLRCWSFHYLHNAFATLRKQLFRNYVQNDFYIWGKIAIFSDFYYLSDARNDFLLPRDAMLSRYTRMRSGVSVCLSVSLSQVAVLLKRPKLGSRKQHHTIAMDSSFLLPKMSLKIKWVTSNGDAKCRWCRLKLATFVKRLA